MGRVGARVRFWAVAACAAALALSGRGNVLAVTWNMKWFPSGVANLRAEPRVEAERIALAGRIANRAWREHGAERNAGVVVFAQEMRDRGCCERWAQACGIPGLKVVEASAFKDRTGVETWQQIALLSDLPVLERGTSGFRSVNGVALPRGFVHAVFDLGANGVLIAAGLHLKSNLNRTGEELETQRNMYKREGAALQILEKIRELGKRYEGRTVREVVAGDFNTSDEDLAFVSEATLRSFYGAHFRSCFRGLKPRQRVTLRGSGGFGDATFDYVLYRGFGRIAGRGIFDGSGVSDHNLVAICLDEVTSRASAR